MQSVRYQMLERQNDELAVLEDEDAAEVDADAETTCGSDDTSLIRKHLAVMAVWQGRNAWTIGLTFFWI